MNFLTEDEMYTVGVLKERGILLPYKKEDLIGLTKNGGCSVICGDGDIDASEYHQETVTPRNHGIQAFGGPNIFAPSFRGHDTGLIEGLLRNAAMGMGAKMTGEIFLYPHWPCAMGKLFGYDMLGYLALMYEVIPVFEKISNTVHTFYHVAKKFADHEEQNTYKLVLPKDGLTLL